MARYLDIKISRKRWILLPLLLLCVFIDAGAKKTVSLAADSLLEFDESVIMLQEVTVRPKKEKYKKKGNPAYELMQDVRKNKEKFDPALNDNYSYDFHEKIVLGLNDIEISENSPKNVRFLKRYADTAAFTFLPVVLVSLKENIGTRVIQKDPKKDKTIILGQRNEGIDRAFDQDNINKALADVLREVDVYKNEIVLFSNHFASPLSNIAGDFYHYNITDTVTFANDSNKYVELSFTPVNPESFGFNGRLYVSTDSTRFIKRIFMRVPRVINLNYVDNIFIYQEFEQDSLGYRHKTLDDMVAEIQIIPGTQSFYGRRTVGKRNFTYEPRSDFKKFLSQLGNRIEIQEGENENSDLLWNQMRILPLSEAERNISDIHQEMRKVPLFYWGEKIVMILAKGYIGTGVNGRKSKFDIGPVNTMISYNTLEGVRLRFGGMTTGSLSPHLFGRAYVAYGFHDHRWKYMGEAEYSFNPKKVHSREFPIHSLRATHQYDVDMLGQHYLFTNADNVFLSLKRKESYLATYQRLSKFEYTLELMNNFSVVAGLQHQIQYATRFVPFVNGNDDRFPHFNQSSFYIRLRYAPGENFVEGRTVRLPVNMDAPIFQLTHEFGPKGFLGSAYTMNVTEFSFQKRFWFSAFGYIDAILKAGKVWSKVQYPSLLWPNANLSYTIQPESYSLMNPMEFANDWYGSLDMTYWLNGLIFNRIPFIKKAKLREILTFKLLMGGLTNKNNPEYNADLFRFPYDSQTHIMSAKPYMEIGAGIDNILTILRVDYVWRLTYRDLPGIDRSGLRISLHFNF